MINNNELINQIKSYNKFLNSESLSKAYDFALEAHQHQKREEGVPYIIHPVAVAKILPALRSFMWAVVSLQCTVRTHPKIIRILIRFPIRKPRSRLNICFKF